MATFHLFLQSGKAKDLSAPLYLHISHLLGVPYFMRDIIHYKHIQGQ